MRSPTSKVCPMSASAQRSMTMGVGFMIFILFVVVFGKDQAKNSKTTKAILVGGLTPLEPKTNCQLALTSFPKGQGQKHQVKARPQNCNQTTQNHYEITGKSLQKRQKTTSENVPKMSHFSKGTSTVGTSSAWPKILERKCTTHIEAILRLTEWLWVNIYESEWTSMNQKYQNLKKPQTCFFLLRCPWTNPAKQNT